MRDLNDLDLLLAAVNRVSPALHDSLSSLGRLPSMADLRGLLTDAELGFGLCQAARLEAHAFMAANINTQPPRDSFYTEWIWNPAINRVRKLPDDEGIVVTRWDFDGFGILLNELIDEAWAQYRARALQQAWSEGNSKAVRGRL